MGNVIKRLLIFCIVAVFFAGPTCAEAPYSTSRTLEYSLLGLKESAQKLQEKNEWFVEESERLRLEIEMMKNNFKKLEEERRVLRQDVQKLA